MSGGYDMEPRWLAGETSILGTVAGFIPGQDQSPAAVVKLDRPITVDGITGEVLVLQLRYVSATWGRRETVHVELCDFTPVQKRWQDRQRGKWVESHATYERLGV